MSEDTIIKCLLSARLKLGGIVWSILRDSHAAEDILQDVFVKALARKEQFESESHLVAWARVTCQNAAIDLYRQQVNRRNLLQDAALEAIGKRLIDRPDHALDDAIDALRACLRRLPEKARSVMHDRYKGDESVKAIASKLGCSLDAVYKTISRAHQKLRECVKESTGKGVTSL